MKLSSTHLISSGQQGLSPGVIPIQVSQYTPAVPQHKLQDKYLEYKRFHIVILWLAVAT